MVHHRSVRASHAARRRGAPHRTRSGRGAGRRAGRGDRSGRCAERADVGDEVVDLVGVEGDLRHRHVEAPRPSAPTGPRSSGAGRRRRRRRWSRRRASRSSRSSPTHVGPMPAPSTLVARLAADGPWPVARPRCTAAASTPPPPPAAVVDGALASPPSSPPQPAAPSASGPDEQQGGKAATDHDGESRTTPVLRDCAAVARNSTDPGSAACHHGRAARRARDAVRGVDGRTAAGARRRREGGPRRGRAHPPARAAPRSGAGRPAASAPTGPVPAARCHAHTDGDRRGEHGGDVVHGSTPGRGTTVTTGTAGSHAPSGSATASITRVWLATSTLGTSSRSAQRRIGADSAVELDAWAAAGIDRRAGRAAHPSSSAPGSISPLVSSGGPPSSIADARGQPVVLVAEVRRQPVARWPSVPSTASGGRAGTPRRSVTTVGPRRGRARPRRSTPGAPLEAERAHQHLGVEWRPAATTTTSTIAAARSTAARIGADVTRAEDRLRQHQPDAPPPGRARRTARARNSTAASA